ncbi:MAG: phospho-sugar mutase, partial [Bacteroidota bacterium]
NLYKEHGCFEEDLVSITLKGLSGVEKIKQMMSKLRTDPPRELGGVQVLEICDFKTQLKTDLKRNITLGIDLPKSDVLQFILTDGSKISVRPSGTEPKIKFYFSLRNEMNDVAEYSSLKANLSNRIVSIKEEILSLSE